MISNVSEHSFFITGTARFGDLIYLVIKDRGLAARDVEHSRFIAFDGGELAHMGDRNWSSVAACVALQPAQKLVAISEDGDVFTYVGGVAADETITPAPIVLRNIAAIGGFPVACGMKRQVYRRVADARWDQMHAPTPTPEENAGFEAIAGFSLQEIYAVGWNGEIWQFDGATWKNRSSPTNVILTGVCCTSDEVYACGQQGTLLVGRNDTWRQLEFENFLEDFWDITWFGNTIYLATMTMLYTYDGRGLNPVEFGEDIPSTCYRLTHAEGVLWSVGSDDVLSFDGTNWSRSA